MPRAVDPFKIKTGPSKLEQGDCRTFDELRALYERYGAEPARAAARAKWVMAARDRKSYCRKKASTTFKNSKPFWEEKET